MINLQVYRKWLLSRVNQKRQSNASRAMESALPYAVKQAIDLVVFHSYDESLKWFAKYKEDNPSAIPEEFSHLRLTLLLCDESICEVLSYMLHKDFKKLLVLETDLRVHDLPLVKIHLDMLNEEYLSSQDLEEVDSDY